LQSGGTPINMSRAEEISEVDEPYQSNFKVDVAEKTIKNNKRRNKILKKVSKNVGDSNHK